MKPPEPIETKNSDTASETKSSEMDAQQNQSPLRSKRILIPAAIILILILIFVGWIAARKSNNQETQINETGQNNKSQAFSPNSVHIKSETETLSSAPATLSLGFNNAEQVVEDKDGNTYTVWVSSADLQIAKRGKDGVITQTRTIASGSITLPAIAINDQVLSVAWVDRTNGKELVKAVISADKGGSITDPVTLGSGSGVSIAAHSSTLVAAWHEGKENESSKIMFSRYDGKSWSTAKEIDGSDKAPVWAAIAVRNSSIVATWRDNRTDNYSIWLRRSLDGGDSWQNEQQLTTDNSGDPDVCISDNNVWVAHHGKTKISLLNSTDGGASFGKPQTIGSGWFAHLSCTKEAVAIGWEATTQNAQAKNKQAGWALYKSSGEKIESEDISDGDTAAATVFLTSDSRQLEVLWVKINGDKPLVGELRHKVFEIR